MPLDNKYLIKNIIYKATISSAKETKNYIGSTGNTFKSRWYNHNNSFKKLSEKRDRASKTRLAFKKQQDQLKHKIEHPPPYQRN